MRPKNVSKKCVQNMSKKCVQNVSKKCVRNTQHERVLYNNKASKDKLAIEYHEKFDKLVEDEKTWRIWKKEILRLRNEKKRDEIVRDYTMKKQKTPKITEKKDWTTK